MNLTKKDLILLLLCLFTVTVWIVPIINPIVYLFIFIYLYISKRPISWYIVVLLFSIPSYHDDSIVLADYFLTIILFFYVILRKKDLKELKLGKLGLLLAIYAVYALASLFWSKDKLDSLFGWFTLIEGFMVYFIVMNGDIKPQKSDYPTISKMATYFMLTMTLELIYYYLTGNVQKIINLKEINLSWGISNYVAIFYTLAMPVALYKYSDKSKFYPVHFLFDFINILGLILTLSRGGLLSTAIAILIFILFHLSYKAIFKYGLLTLLFSSVIYFIQRTGDITNLIIHHFLLVKMNDSGRYKIWDMALQAFKHSPIFGNGYFSAAFILPAHSVYLFWFHNFILDVGVSLGVVGLILVFIILLKSFQITFKPKDAFLITIFASLIGFLFDSLLDIGFNFWTCGLVMYGLVAIAECVRQNQRNVMGNVEETGAKG